MLRSIAPHLGRCTRHNRHHFGTTCPDCARHAAALRQQDELTRRAAREWELRGAELVDNGPAATGSGPALPLSLPTRPGVGAAGPASMRELSEADRDLAQAIRQVDGINAVIERFLQQHFTPNAERAFAVSDIEVGR